MAIRKYLTGFSPFPLIAGIPAWFAAHGLTSFLRLTTDTLPTHEQWLREMTTSKGFALIWVLPCFLLGVFFGLDRRVNGRDSIGSTSKEEKHES
jgi:hypothetical protein